MGDRWREIGDGLRLAPITWGALVGLFAGRLMTLLPTWGVILSTLILAGLVTIADHLIRRTVS